MHMNSSVLTSLMRQERRYSFAPWGDKPQSISMGGAVVTRHLAHNYKTQNKKKFQKKIFKKFLPS